MTGDTTAPTLSATHIKLVNSVSKRLFLVFAVILVIMLVLVIVSAFTAHISVAFIVLPAGIIGGFVGLQRRLKQLSVQDLQLIEGSWRYTLLAPLVGGILAFLLFILFLSGLLEGELFPDLVSQSEGQPAFLANLLRTRGQEVSDDAKLIFWAFVAGYSERFVTDIIGRFEQQANG